MLPVVTHRLSVKRFKNTAMSTEDLKGFTFSIDNVEGIEEAFENLHATAGDIDLIVATDSEASSESVTGV
nr:hypothetical protein [Bacillus amyloliquefaciens]